MRWTLDVTLHTLGATLSAGAFGAALGAVGALLGAPWGASSELVIAAVAVGAAARELVGAPFLVPQLRRQVPDWWRTFFGPHAASALYGVGLGVGFFTYLTHATLVVVSVAAMASGRPVTGMLLVAPFGLVRGASVAAAAWSARGDLVHRLARIGRHPAIAIANGAVAVAVAVVAILQASSRPIPAAEVAAAALALAFAWSAGAKVAHVSEWWRALPAYRLGRFTRVVAIAVPALEAAVPALVVVRASRTAGVLALVVLGAFSFALIRVRALGRTRMRCGCFGTSERPIAQLLIRNAAIGAIAVIVTSAGPAGGPALSLPVTGQVLPFLMSIAGLGVITALALQVHRSLR